MRMRQLYSVGKILLLLVLAWLLVLVFVGGPLIRGSDGQQEEILAKRLVESQGEVAALKRERDALARNLRTMGKGEQVMMMIMIIEIMAMMMMVMMILMLMMMILM